jgi:ArsR family transcriptional regulator
MSTPCCSGKPAVTIKDLDALTGVYGALADPTRLRILALLRDGEVCVCHIHAALDAPQPTVSRHLAYLRKCGLVDARREGTWMHYRLRRPASAVVAAVVDAALHALSHCSAHGGDAARLRRSRARA